MTRFPAAASLAVLTLALAACGPRPSSQAPQSAGEVATAQAPATSQSGPEAAASEGAPASEAAPASGTASPAVAPGPITSTVIPLQIKTDQGQPVSGNPASGQQDFVVCSACHSVQPGQNMVGPSLHGVVGRHAGTVPGFHYSSANKNSGLVWTEQELFTYLESPQKIVPGTYMTYIGMKDPQQRADVIAYLQQAGG
ncbi:MAG TPA: cytochrome c family protein [Caulobacteraceae bacterium]|jgi:cytochrome c|nr:cytochrome c family protein [Caulobacteraceae bacterium]